jgi:AraC-like DNA-binding protein
MQPADLAPAVFSTVGLPDARRVELWEMHNTAVLVGLTVHAGTPLEATELNVQLSQIHLARVAGSAHAVERTAKVIGCGPTDAIVVYLPLQGVASFSQQGSTLTLRPGEALICDPDQPFARGFARGLEELVVKVPRAAIEAQAGVRSFRHPAVATFGRAGGGDQYANALARLAGRAVRTERPVPADERTVLDLVAVLAVGPRVALSVAHRAAARSFIEEHLTDPGLGADQIAAAIGISERQLSRVFAADGMSVPRHILSRRLELARAMLASRAGADQGGSGTVADIAARCGFVSVTYFSHVFRAHFGLRAGEVMRDARASFRLAAVCVRTQPCGQGLQRQAPAA